MTAANYDHEYTALARRDAREETALKAWDAATLARLCCPVRLANDLRTLERIRRDMEAKRRQRAIRAAIQPFGAVEGKAA